MISKLQQQREKKEDDFTSPDSFFSHAVSNMLKTDLFCSLHNNIWVLWVFFILGLPLCLVFNAPKNLLQCCTFKQFSCLSNFYCDAMHSLSTPVIFQDLRLTLVHQGQSCLNNNYYFFALLMGLSMHSSILIQNSWLQVRLMFNLNVFVRERN